MREADAPRDAAQQPRELLIAAPEIEDGRDRVVLLRVGYHEVHEERLPCAGGPGHERVPDVVDVEIPEIRRLLLGLEGGEVLPATQVRARARAGVECEEEA